MKKYVKLDKDGSEAEESSSKKRKSSDIWMNKKATWRTSEAWSIKYIPQAKVIVKLVSGTKLFDWKSSSNSVLREVEINPNELLQAGQLFKHLNEPSLTDASEHPKGSISSPNLRESNLGDCFGMIYFSIIHMSEEQAKAERALREVIYSDTRATAEKVKKALENARKHLSERQFKEVLHPLIEKVETLQSKIGPK